MLIPFLDLALWRTKDVVKQHAWNDEVLCLHALERKRERWTVKLPESCSLIGVRANSRKSSQLVIEKRLVDND